MTILCQVKCWNAISKLKKGEILQNFPGILTNTRIPNSIQEKPNLLANTSPCSDSSQYAVFSQSLVQISPHILMKVFEKTTFSFFIWAAWVLFNFYLKQKQSFSVWSFTENASFISFYEGIWSITLSIKKTKKRS